MRRALVLASILATLALPALAAPSAPAEADEATVARFVVDAVSATMTRGGEGGDGAWLTRVVSMTSTDGANAVLKLWGDAGLADEPATGTSYSAQVSGSPELRHLATRAWRARAIVLQTYERGSEKGGTGMTIEARVVQDERSGVLRIDGITLRE